MGRAQVVLELPPPVGVASFCLPLRWQNMTKLLSLEFTTVFKISACFQMYCIPNPKRNQNTSTSQWKKNEAASTPMFNDQSHKSQRMSRAASWMFLDVSGCFRIFLWRFPEMEVPSGELTWQWKITIFNGKIHYKWPFSIAMLVHQRVPPKSSNFRIFHEINNPKLAYGVPHYGNPHMFTNLINPLLNGVYLHLSIYWDFPL